MILRIRQQDCFETDWTSVSVEDVCVYVQSKNDGIHT